MFISVPPVCDRWMEGVEIFELGDVLRYLWSQLYWTSHINTRFFSNFLSYLVDNNCILHALINAMMLTSFSFISIYLNRTENFRDKAIISTFSCFCLILVSNGIYKEVYFYASTLYLSSFLIVCIILVLNIRLAEELATKKDKLLLCIFIAIGSSWLESNIFPILALTGSICLIKSLEQKKIDKKTLLPIALSIICAFSMLGIAYCIQPNSKLVQNAGHITFMVEPLVDLIKNNCLLLIILSAVMIMNIVHYKRTCPVTTKKRLLLVFQIIMWSLMLAVNLILEAQHIYNVIRTEPNDTLKGLYGWYTVQNKSIESFFNTFMDISYIVFPICIILATISIIYMLYLTKRHLIGIPVLLMGCAGTVIVVLGLYSGERISSSAIFSLILLIGILVQNILINQSNANYVTKWWRGCFRTVSLITCASVYSVFIFLHSQNEVANKRQMIAEEVKKQQALGTWDYNSFVIMPVYSVSADGRELVGEDRKNPINRDAYYPFLLRYYDLEADTKVIFSDDYSLQIIKLVYKDDTACLYANSLYEYEDVLYKFQVIEDVNSEDEEDIEDIDALVIAESDWLIGDMWLIPENCLHKKNIKYRCYIVKNGNILIEKEGDAISWQEETP